MRSAALAPMRERAFRLLFAGRFVAFLGNAVAPIALAFAVLDLTGSATDLGVVLAARAVPQVVLTLLGGVFADRIPRHRVLVAASSLSALSQATVAFLLLTGDATVAALVVLELANGSAAAFIYPAAAGLTPQTVPAPLLQQANALLRLGLNAATIGGAALGGLLVAAVGPGWALLVDAGAFACAAVLLGAIRLPAGDAAPMSNVLAQLREGWHEFRSRTWLWVVVVQFAFVNAAFVAGFAVLGPVVADGTVGRGAWGLVLAAQAAGMVVGGLLALRFRPARPLLVATLGIFCEVPLLVVLAVAPSTAGLLAAALVAGIGIETFGIYWDLSLQQHVPADRLSRVAAYDALGSFVFIPVGQLAAGPLAHLLGVRDAIALAAGVVFVATLLTLAVRSVRELPRADAPAATAAAGAAT